MLKYFQPGQFTELFGGSGTGYDVAREMGYTDSVHMDLNEGFGQDFHQALRSGELNGKIGGWNALTDDIPVSSEFVFSHPPYHNMVVYSGSQWGKPHADDLSRCASYEEFIQKLNLVNAKVYASLKSGGRHAILIGDLRRKGKYYSIIKDMAYYGELESHMIKAQHHCLSDNNSYSGNFIRISHEHLLVFRKQGVWVVPITAVKKGVRNLTESDTPTWRDLVAASMEHLGGKATLEQIYSLLQGCEKAVHNTNWKAKIRQTLQMYPDFHRVKRGVYQSNSKVAA
ncbi:DNA methylase N-4/N-6 [Lentibacillus salinarum]|uniref:DNA methylase N-4/N-6 n=1 Tax=Lentibacillus salinarum TaxID=446820 RepID=A0ABW3ZWY5_9BACI